jgi:hypothetical protein
MGEDWNLEQRKRADVHLAEFLAKNPDCSLDDGKANWLKGTHLVTFGQYRGKPAVFKFYDWDPRKRYEQAALEAFLPTGLVPKIYGGTDLMTVMEKLPGIPVHEAREKMTPQEWDLLNFRLGEAVAKVVKAEPGKDKANALKKAFRAGEEKDFYKLPHDELAVLYRQADTETFFDTTLFRAEKTLKEREFPHKDVLGRSLSLLKKNRDAILAYPRFLHMDDYHDNNIMTYGGKISGFIDLEMTFYGSEIQVLGGVLISMRRQRDRWQAFRRGYEAVRGKELDDNTLALARIVAPFSQWIRFNWYCTIDDLPWWAKEENLGLSTVRCLKESIEALETAETQ